jgi:DNA mismatch repair ATPase MutS
MEFKGFFSSFRSLDAVEELMQDKEYEFRLGKMTKGLPDLERVVSRIHAGNCKIRDFLKVLDVRYLPCLVQT